MSWSRASVAVLLCLGSTALAGPAASAGGPAALAERTLFQPKAGLIWMEDAAFAVKAGLADSLVLPRAEALARLRLLNAGKADNLGHADWRLPTPAELSRRLALEEAGAKTRPANVEVLRAAVSALATGRGNLVALVPVRAGLIPPGFPDVVVFATNSIHIKNDSVVGSGDVVANDAATGPTLAGAELVIGPQASSSAKSALKADSVRVKSRTTVGGDVHYNDLVNQGTITGALVTPLALPVFAGTPSFESGTPGVTDVVVAANDTLNLPAGAYRKLQVGHGARVFFTGGTYDFEEVTAESTASLLFDAAADVRVAGRFSSDADAVVGPSPGAPISAADVVFFVAGANQAALARGATLAAAEVGVRNQVRANFYVPNGTLQIKNDAQATGAFLGRDVEAGPHATLALQSAFFNKAPVAVDDSASGVQGGTITMLDSGATSVLANDSDPNGDVLAVDTTPVAGPVHGTLALQADGTFSYTHDGSDSSLDAFTYQVCDQGFPVLCDTATVTISIEIPPYTVTVEKAGTGTGTVTSSPAGIDCGAVCSASFASFLTVSLEALPDPGSIFTGWSGDADCADGIVGGAATCVANFEAFAGVTLTVEKLGDGSGYVASNPLGIDCGARCSADFPPFARVELVAVADPGSAFAGFGGDPDCEDGEVAMDVAKTCTVMFVVPPPPLPSSRLTVILLGDGVGTVSSNPAGIICEGQCEALFPDGATVTLFARPEVGEFVEWGGDCSGTTFSASVTIGPDKTCTATFAVPVP